MNPLPALQAQRDNLLNQVGNLEEQIDDMDERGLRQTQERNDLMDRREDLINQLVPIQQEIQDILNPPPPIPYDPNSSSSSSRIGGGSFIPSRGRTKLNVKIKRTMDLKGGCLGCFSENFMNKVFYPVANLVSKVAVPVVSAVAPELAPAIGATMAAKKVIGQATNQAS